MTCDSYAIQTVRYRYPMSTGKCVSDFAQDRQRTENANSAEREWH